MAKNILNQSFHLDQFAVSEMESYAQAIALGSEYYGEATRRFMEKEPPVFDWDVPFGPGAGTTP
jgi:2-(1,2-epoxy-1,2-dihydrophenyl)acetyl-CoA isomerase